MFTSVQRSTLTMASVRANLIARGLVVPASVAKAAADTRHGTQSNARAIAARRSELGFVPVIVKRAKRVYQQPSAAKAA